MPKGVKHYFKDGTEHKGGMHKMPNGEMHSAHGTTTTVNRLCILASYLNQQKRKQQRGGDDARYSQR